MIRNHHLGRYQKEAILSLFQLNLQIVATEIYKIGKDFSPPIIRDITKLRSKQT